MILKLQQESFLDSIGISIKAHNFYKQSQAQLGHSMSQFIRPDSNESLETFRTSPTFIIGLSFSQKNRCISTKELKFAASIKHGSNVKSFLEIH
jgi:hypothetical protein